MAGCTAPDEVAFNAGAAHKRMVWSLPADKASAPCEEGRQLTALMPCLCACVLLISSPPPVGDEDVQHMITTLQTCCCSIVGYCDWLCLCSSLVDLSVDLDTVHSSADGLQTWRYHCRPLQHRVSCKVAEEQMVDSCCASHLASHENS